MKYIANSLKKWILGFSLIWLSSCASVDGSGPNVATDIQSLTQSTQGMSTAQLELVSLAKESAQIRLVLAGAGVLIGTLMANEVCDNMFCKVATIAAVTQLAYMGGAYVAAKREYAIAEQGSLRSSIQSAKNSINFYNQRIAAAEKVVNQHSRRIDQLNRNNLNNEALRKQYKQEYDVMVLDRARIKSFAEQAQGDVNFMEQELQSRGSSASNRELSALEQQRDNLRERNRRLEQQLERLDRELARVPADIQGFS